MILGILSSDMGSLRASEAYQQVPARVKAEVKGPQSQDIIAPSKMSEERVIYLELKLPYSGKQKDKRCPMDKRRVKDYDSFQENWYCCGKSCYYFSKEEKTWERSKKSCEDLSSSLIKIDNKEEQNIIQSKIKYNYWIGLHKTEARPSWKWLDGTLLSQM
ncbi:hypothetical protein GH733_014513, partial [Mirounga leonina]